MGWGGGGGGGGRMGDDREETKVEEREQSMSAHRQAGSEARGPQPRR
jgi:hypothetical protein